MADKIPDFTWLKDIPAPDPEIVAALAEREAAKWDHQTWDVVITDREVLLRHLERSCGGEYPKPFMSTEGHNDVAVGQGPTPRGLRYSIEMLKALRDEGLVTSWRDLKREEEIRRRGNTPSTSVGWYFGSPDEWGFEGPGVLDGEEI